MHHLQNPTNDHIFREEFTGKEFDEEGIVTSKDATKENVADGIKLFYFGARYYDRELGIWTAPDPADEFWSGYSYVGGNVINLIDPNGLETHKPSYSNFYDWNPFGPWDNGTNDLTYAQSPLKSYALDGAGYLYSAVSGLGNLVVGSVSNFGKSVFWTVGVPGDIGHELTGWTQRDVLRFEMSFKVVSEGTTLFQWDLGLYGVYTGLRSG